MPMPPKEPLLVFSNCFKSFGFMYIECWSRCSSPPLIMSSTNLRSWSSSNSRTYLSRTSWRTSTINCTSLYSRVSAAYDFCVGVVSVTTNPKSEIDAMANNQARFRRDMDCFLLLKRGNRRTTSELYETTQTDARGVLDLPLAALGSASV